MGVCNVGGGSDGEAWQVWVELAKDTISFTYHQQGIRKVGGVYALNEDRGKPLQVRWVVM